MRVLHVEDNPTDADMTRRALARLTPGLALDSVGTLAAAWERLAPDRPNRPTYDLALLDLRLPDGNGLELLVRIREHRLPLAVVMLTGGGDQESAVAALKAGADDYLSKGATALEHLPAIIHGAHQRFLEASSRQSRTLRVLYAECSGVDAQRTQSHLTRHAPHIRLTVVQDAAAVLQLLPAGPDRPAAFDVVLLDYRQPELDALAVAKVLRQERNLSIPIVLISGHGSEDLAAGAMHLGVDDYLSKHEGYLHALPATLEKVQHLAELTYERAQLRQAALLREARLAVLDRLTGSEPLTAILTQIATSLESIRPELRVSILVRDPRTGRLATGAAPRLPESFNGTVDSLAGVVAFDADAAAPRAAGGAAESVCHRWSTALRELAERAGLHAGGCLPFKDDGGQFLGVVALFSEAGAPRDSGVVELTEEFARLTGLAVVRARADAARRQAATVFASTREGVVITDLTARILAVNRAFTEITGYSEAQLLGENPRMLQSGRHDLGFYQAMWASVHATGHWQGELWNRRQNGETYPQLLSISTVSDEQGHPSHYVGVSADLSQLKRFEERLEHLAHFDPLTDLPNRLLVQSRLEHAIERARRQGRCIAVLSMDLDRFKTLNDSLGHPAGDELLAALARRLRGGLRPDETLARLGGDEFLIILEDLPHPEQAATVAQQIRGLLERPFILASGQEVYVGASIGISLFPADADGVTALIQHADVAMFKAKDEGRNTFQFYTPALTAAAGERLDLEASLWRALANGDFRLYYQPQFAVRGGAPTGVEALVRWRDPLRGLIPPDRFIPVAEETGLIVPLGDWVLRTACAQARAWNAAGRPPLTMAVNLSGRQFQQPGLAGRIRAILAETDLPPAQLRLELTESTVMGRGEEARDLLQSLKALGIRLSIDDFGTGYSSLAYLKRFPVDELKIDRSFVHDIPADPNDMEIAAAIIAMAHNLRLEVVAEGVETQAQLDFLDRQGCDSFQGFLLSRPVEADACAAVLWGGGGAA
ncbi:EAL domain-containing protein [uncultured Thiodictyon sp.]|uniref:EAL domain-containing protein n=1 Tax=uncultured Thiodictyon sp. TaxID=1846217 RepID=UPI0025F71D1A|nr:EAL domain-containing protein [uncultured Thiodictyon sp.]